MGPANRRTQLSAGLQASPAAAKNAKLAPDKEKPGKGSKKKPVVTNAISTKTKLEWVSTWAPGADAESLSHGLASRHEETYRLSCRVIGRVRTVSEGQGQPC